MPLVVIPALLRDLTQGTTRAQVPGATVREVIDHLEVLYPGVRERLCDAGRLRPTLSVIVDGGVSPLRLRQRLQENSEIHFLPAISGG